jgi:prefoldin subunit 5
VSPKPQPIGKMRRRVQQLDDKIERQQKEIDDLRKAIGRLQDIVITVRQKANAGRL